MTDAARSGATPDRGAHGEGYQRTQPRRARVPTMALTLCLWFCLLPVVFLLIVPWLGVRMAAVISLVLLGVIGVASWALYADPRRNKGDTGGSA